MVPSSSLGGGHTLKGEDREESIKLKGKSTLGTTKMVVLKTKDVTK